MSEQQNSADKNTPAVSALNTAGGDGIVGQSQQDGGGRGVVGISDSFDGVFGVSNNNKAAGVSGHNSTGGFGVFGQSQNGGRGVFGKSDTDAGVAGESASFDGVFGVSNNNKAAGVSGHNSTGGFGVFGQSQNGGRGVFGKSDTDAGVVGESDSFDGVFGISHDPKHAGVSGHNLNKTTGKPNDGGLAGFFEGNVVVTGDIFLQNADCAEDFDISAAEKIEPGTVMVLGEDGTLQQSHQTYDKRVAGVVSGAGDFRPGIILDKQTSERVRMPIALLGKVYCKVDARRSSIEVGDLLTTSDTLGHAMKAEDPQRAFGAVIGKALRPLASGQAEIPILVALQ